MFSRPLLILALATTCLVSTSSFAQGKTTIIRQQGDNVEVTQVENELESAFMSCEEADKNGNARIERQEARDAGILSFDRFAGNKGYLDCAEYQQAGSAPN